ncbi:MAG: SDR family NAD(P)-dependent oxidoreductase [Deltaproteobacteria bacterium]|nr:SDR family NAD(P)-dependent oxidoreductase [Deltaproteobacteria bacterium]
MPRDFEAKVALITGAGSGLGLAHAAYFAERGARVVLNDLGGGTLGLDSQGIDAEAADRAAATIRAAGGLALSNNDSVSEPSGAQAMVRRAIDEWGRIDILVNNAGFASAQIFPDVDLEEMQRHVDVTLLGCLNTMRAAWPHMLEQKFGRIVNTGSAAAFGNPIASYASTKAGLFGLTKTVALLASKHDINVNLLLPAAFSRLTDGLPESDFKARLRRDFSPEKVSPVVAYLCHERSAVTGEAFSVGGGKFARIAYAASPAAEIDGTVDSVEKAMPDVMAGTDLRVLRSTHDDMVNLGFPERE